MSDDPSFAYETHLNILAGPLDTIDVAVIVDDCKSSWYNQTLCQVNDSVVRLGVVDGEYHWDKQETEDEFRSKRMK